MGDPSVTTYNTNSLNQYTSTSGPSESFTHDLDGNMTQDGTLTYTWDAENRLSTVTQSNLIVDRSYQWTFFYDYMGRRVRTLRHMWNGTSWASSPINLDRKFVFDGWNAVMELNALSSDSRLRNFTWGLDLSGQSGNPSVSGIHGAGGIGGLLAVSDNSTSKNYLYFYSANGDVTQVMDAASTAAGGAMQARYEYYPFGGHLLGSGTYATTNQFRFSTKFREEFAGYYYGYRYHMPKHGRWLNRDPMEESSDPNLNRLVANNPPLLIDPNGLEIWFWPIPCMPPWQPPTTSQPSPPTTKPALPKPPTPSRIDIKPSCTADWNMPTPDQLAKACSWIDEIPADLLGLGRRECLKRRCYDANRYGRVDCDPQKCKCWCGSADKYWGCSIPFKRRIWICGKLPNRCSAIDTIFHEFAHTCRAFEGEADAIGRWFKNRCNKEGIK